MKELKNKKIEGNISAHQVVAGNARKDEIELLAIEEWLRSYQFEELFDDKNGFDKDILGILPDEKFRIGNNPHVYSHRIYKELVLPDAKQLEKKFETPGKLTSQSMKMAGTYLKEVFRLNQKTKNFRLMSPDETYSNRLDDVFSVTSRGFVWPIQSTDKDITRNGRVMEMLSEHNLHGLAQGYILTGRHAVFTTYEAFAQIFSSMTHQYEKFLKVARTLSWRGDMASMNYMFSSVLWRQEHNGFTHQNPSFISGVLEKHDCHISAYFPVDDNSMIAIMQETLSSKNSINVIVAGKTLEPRWLTLIQSQKQLQQGGIATWDFASDPSTSSGQVPDVVVCGIGDYVTKEALAAVEMIKYKVPQAKIRVVNIIKLHGKCSCTDSFHPQIPDAEKHFTEDKPVIVTFHGYPETIESMLLSVKNPQRFSVHGYQEQGGTTTPFDMHVRNKTSRYHLAIEMIEKLSEQKVISKKETEILTRQYQQALSEHFVYVTTYGVDPIELEEWHFDPMTTIKKDAVQLDVLQKAKTIALVGMSPDPDRYSHKVGIYLKSKGYTIIPVNPSISEVLDEKVYPDVLSIPKDQKVDIVAIYRRSEDVFLHVKEVVKRGNIQTIWLPEGVRNKEAEAFAAKAGITVVSDFCIMKEHQKIEIKE